VKLLIYRFHQDDPRKCSAAKLIRLNLARPIINLEAYSNKAVVLNPFAREVFSLNDRRYLSYGLVTIDCSWKNAEMVFRRRLRGINRRLPHLLPSNPINYGRLSMLSSVEALAAALFIAGYKQEAERILNIFKWGPNFLILNENALKDYSSACDQEQILQTEKDYFYR
jgi:pre-rRNA-processing protein TSR3